MRVPLFDLSVRDKDLKSELVEAFESVLDHGKLFMALKACGISPGDEVITPPLTWIITVNAIAACGAMPVFADVREDLNIDPESIEQQITTKTKAIVPMHYAGHMCEMDSICEIADKNNLIVVEDAAQAYGAMLNGKKAGSFSLAAGLSMNPMKVLGGYGEAGAVVTSDEKIYQRLKRLRHAGTTSDPKRQITNNCLEVSLNHKMDTINAALLLVALRYLPEKRKRRKEIAMKYDQELPPEIIHQVCYENELHGLYVYPIKVENRDELKVFLQNKLIETKIFNEPLACDAPVYKNKHICDVPVARKMLATNLILPSHEMLREEEVVYVINSISKFF